MKDNRSFFERLTGSGHTEDLSDTEKTEEKLPNNKASVNGGNWLIKSMVAGVKPEDLDISITRDMVTIKGKRETERFVKDEDYFHRELYWGSFSRTIMLPTEIEVEEAEAIEKHGLLVLRLPKIDKHRQTRLRVKG